MTTQSNPSLPFQVTKVKKLQESLQKVNDSGMFIVKSPSGKEHRVQFVAKNHLPHCTCKDWTRWHIPCKHFLAVFTYFPQWGWDRLPKNYLDNEYLSADTSALCYDSSSHSSVHVDDELRISQTVTDDLTDLNGGENMATHNLPKHHVSKS